MFTLAEGAVITWNGIPFQFMARSESEGADDGDSERDLILFNWEKEMSYYSTA